MNDSPDQVVEVVKASMDYGVAPGITVAALLGYMPGIAALLAVVWYLIRIYETETVQALVKKVTSKWHGRVDLQE